MRPFFHAYSIHRLKVGGDSFRLRQFDTLCLEPVERLAEPHHRVSAPIGRSYHPHGREAEARSKRCGCTLRCVATRTLQDASSGDEVQRLVGIDKRHTRTLSLSLWNPIGRLEEWKNARLRAMCPLDIYTATGKSLWITHTCQTVQLRVVSHSFEGRPG